MDSMQTYQSFMDMIQAGNYDFLHGLARYPEGIKGWDLNQPVRETEPCHLKQRLKVQQVYDLLGNKLASYKELLDYGIKNLDPEWEFPVATIWKDEGGQLCFALIRSDFRGRRLVTRPDHPEFEWDYDVRFLVCK